MCKKSGCVTLRTQGVLKVALANNAPCDHGLAGELAGSLAVPILATAYEKDGRGRGVHAGDFKWVTAKKDEIDGADLRDHERRPVPPGALPGRAEKCVAEGILVGRLCGRVVKTLNPELNGAQVVATYRFHTTSTAKGESGPAVADAGGRPDHPLLTPVRASGPATPGRSAEADDGIRTRDTWLGKPVLYQLSYVRRRIDSSRARKWRLRRPFLS